MSHSCKCGQIFFSEICLNDHQKHSDCMLDKYTILDLYNNTKEAREKIAADFVKSCHNQILECVKDGLYSTSVDITPILGKSGMCVEILERLQKLFSEVEIEFDRESKTIDISWGISNLIEKEACIIPQIYNIESTNIKINDLGVLINRGIYKQLALPENKWDSKVKMERFIGSIMLGLPIPCLYMSQDHTGIQCFDGLKRISAILDYINQKAEIDHSLSSQNLFAWKPSPSEYVYFKETGEFIKYVSSMSEKDKYNTYRFMTCEERTKFINYTLGIYIIHGNLNSDERDFIERQITIPSNINIFDKRYSKNRGFSKTQTSKKVVSILAKYT
jgi:hypothetical protein